jgi:hypothetical protein
MTDRLYIVRNRKKRLLDEEEYLAKALRGKWPPKYFRLDERKFPNKRAGINFYFEYFMTFHINNFKIRDKLWCDGALIETLSQRKNKYLFGGHLYLLPEDEVTPNKWKFIKTWSKFPFKGFVELHENTDKIKDYKFKIQMESLEFTCKRKI